MAAAFLEQERDTFEVETATDAEAGLACLEDGEFDCVVSDFDMPGTDGLAFLRAVRRSHPSLPFILFTGKGSEEVASDAISAGVTEYLQKRPSTEQFLLLANRIEQAVSRTRAERLMTRGFQAMDLANDGIALLDSNGRFSFSNRTFATFFGYHAAELVGEHWSLLTTGYSPDGGSLPADSVDAGRHGEMELRCKDGSVVVADLSFERTGDGDRICLVTDVYDETGAKRSPKRAQQRLDLLVEAVSEYAIFMLDTDGYVQTWNTGARRLTGYDRDEILGEHFSTFSPDDAVEAGAPAALLERAREAESAQEEEWQVRKDGSTFWASVTLTAVHDADGELTGFGTVTHDLSERDERAGNGHHEGRSLDPALDALDDIFYVADTDFELCRVNDRLATVTGYSVAELESMTLLDVVVPDERESTRVRLQRALDGDNDTTELTLRTTDGDRIPFEVNQSALRDESDRLVGLVGVGRDLSSRRAHEHDLELQAKQQRVVATLSYRALDTDSLDDLFDEAVRAVADTLDMDYCKVLDLDAGADRLGLRAGVGWHDGTVGEAAVENDRTSQAGYTLLSEEPVVVPAFDEETRFTSPPLLTEHDVSSGISVVIGSVDDPWGVLGVHDTEPRGFTDTDINFVQSVANVLASAIENRAHQRRLERQNDQLETFASFLSHDLRSPLSVAQGRLELGRASCDNEHLAAVESAHDRMSAMIDELLSSSREQSEHPPSAETVLLSAVAESAWGAVPTGDTTLQLDADEQVEAEPGQLQRLFENLFRNAVEHGGSTTIRVGLLDDREGGFYVEDDGSGLSDVERERIFEQGFTSSPEGSGLGLRIVERVAETHGWDVVAVDGNDGGARFEVRFTGSPQD